MGMMMSAMRRGRGPGKGQFSSREANWVWHALKRKITCKEEEKEDPP